MVASSDASFKEDQEPSCLFSTLRIAGDYELLEEIGRGGMGIVYKAWQHSLQRIVAVKIAVIHGGGFSPEQRKEVKRRIGQEAPLAAAVSNPHLISIHAVGILTNEEARQVIKRIQSEDALCGRHTILEQDFEAIPFFSMNYVQGTDLNRLPEGSPIDPRQAAQNVQIVAAAIHCAHEKLIHRDLKPSNILRGTDGWLYVTDFGIGKRLDPSTDGSVRDDCAGTPQYMAPEQVTGGQIDRRTDVYGLGAVLYFLLTGRPPFKAATDLDTLYQVINALPAAPRLLNPAIVADLEAVCLKCLNKAPMDRYDTAKDLADDLQRFLDGMPTYARPVGLFGRLWRLMKRHPIAAALANVLLLALTVFAIWANNSRAKNFFQLQATQFQRANDLANVGRLPEALALLSKVIRANPRNSLATERLMFLLTHRKLVQVGAAAVIESNAVRVARFNREGSVLASLTRDGSATNWVRHWVTQTHWVDTKAPLAGTNRLRFSIFSDDLRWLAAADHSQVVRIFDTANGQERCRLMTNDTVLKLAFNAGSTLLRVVTMNGSVLSWTGDSDWSQVQQAPVVHLRKWETELQSVVFSEDSHILAAALPDGRLAIWDAISGSQLSNFSHGHQGVPELQFSTDLGTLMTWDGMESVRVWNWRHAILISELQDEERVKWAAISPRGDCVVTIGNVSGLAKAWETRGNVRLTEPFGQPQRLQKAFFHPGGDRLATVSELGTVLLWNVRTNSTPNPDLSPLADTKHATFSSDGRLFAVVHAGSEGSVVEAWRTDNGRPAGLKLVHGKQVDWLAFSPNSKCLATVSQDHTGRLWRMESDSIPRLLTGHSDWVTRVEFNSDGTQLLTASHDCTARLWSMRSAQQSAVLTGHTDQLRAAVFSPDRQWILTGSADRTARLWTVTPLQCVRTNAHQTQVVLAAISPDSRWAATAGADEVVQLWAIKHDAAPTRQLRHPKGVAHFVFSPDSRLLMTAGADGAAWLWRIKDSTPDGMPLRQKDALVQAVFSVDGSRVATLTEHGAVVIWDVSTRLPISDPLPGNFNVALGVSFDRSGERVLTWGTGGVPKLWFVPKASRHAPEWLPPLAETIAGWCLDRTDTLQPVVAEQILTLRKQSSEAIGPLAPWFHWFLSHPNQRSAFPE